MVGVNWYPIICLSTLLKRAVLKNACGRKISISHRFKNHNDPRSKHSLLQNAFPSDYGVVKLPLLFNA
jgi:hypothetical protein